MKRKAGPATIASDRLLRFEPVDRGSVTSRIYRHVKQALMRGEFEPGQVITIDSMAQVFGTSHMPVREALGRLVTANALVALPNRSVAVPRISVEALRDIMNVRAEIEGFAGRLAATHCDAAAMAEIMVHHRGMAAAIEAQDVREYLAAHQAFHFTIYATGKSTSLPQLIETLWLQSGPYLNVLATDDSFQPDGSEHDQIMAALASRNPKATERAVKQGINGALATLEILVEHQTQDRASSGSTS